MAISSMIELSEFERAAEQAMPAEFWAYLSGGAGNDKTVRANSAAFDAYRLVPGIGADGCSSPVTSRTLCGRILSMPVLLAPTSPLKLFHPEAELAAARAACDAGTIIIVSTDSHFDLPEIAAAAGGAWWFQLYAYRSRDHVERLVRLAEDSGAEAIVVTMDAHFAARRFSTERARFQTPPDVEYGVMRSVGIDERPRAGHARIERLPLAWSDIEWLRGSTSLPLIIKGVMRSADARRALDVGVDGLIVSNHGGRQLDGGLASLEALAEIARVVPDDRLLLMDGGVRCGGDIVKALALGASAVCIGRPYLWGLYLAGQQGVKAVLDLIAADLRSTLQQLGVAHVDALDHDVLSGGVGGTGGAVYSNEVQRYG
jgi:4-hydroxymandelate oxidase